MNGGWDAATVVTVVAALVAAVASVISVLLGSRAAGHREREQWLRASRRPVYGAVLRRMDAFSRAARRAEYSEDGPDSGALTALMQSVDELEMLAPADVRHAASEVLASAREVMGAAMKLWAGKRRSRRLTTEQRRAFAQVLATYDACRERYVRAVHTDLGVDSRRGRRGPSR